MNFGLVVAVGCENLVAGFRAYKVDYQGMLLLLPTRSPCCRVRFGVPIFGFGVSGPLRWLPGSG